MAFKTEIYGDVAVIRLDDELTGDNVPRFQNALDPSLQEGIRNVVVDMEKTEYLDNSGLEAFADLRDRLQEAGGQLKLSGLGASCRKIFELTGLDKQVDLFETLIDAVKSFH